MTFGFDIDRSRVNIDMLISTAVNTLSNTLIALINGKSDIGHTHAASDVTSGTLSADRIPNLSTSKLTSGTLAVARGGTGQTTLQATRNAMGLGNTTGALPIANGGTGKTTAADARSALGATGKRNLSANYAGSTSGSPDFLVKSFTGSFTTSSSSYSKDVTITVSNYLPIAVAGFNCHGANNSGYNAHAYFKNGTTVTVEGVPGTGFTVNYTVQVLYVRTAMINQ